MIKHSCRTSGIVVSWLRNSIGLCFLQLCVRIVLAWLACISGGGGRSAMVWGTALAGPQVPRVARQSWFSFLAKMGTQLVLQEPQLGDPVPFWAWEEH